MKKYCILLTLIIIPFISFCQKDENRTLLIISPISSNSVCETIAIKVEQSKIEIDDCYDQKSKNFNSTTSLELNKLKLVEDIFKTPTSVLKQYKKDIDATNCDFGFPIILIVIENGVETEIDWKDVQNCYPKAVKKIALPLLRLFEKYKRK